MTYQIENIAKIIRISILDAISETKAKLDSVPWNRKEEVKDESFSRKIQEKIKEKVSASLPDIKFFAGGKWSYERYSVVAYTPNLLILIQAHWVFQKEVSLTQVNSLEAKLSKTARRTGGRNILVFLASNRFVKTEAYRKFMGFQHHLSENVKHVEVVNPSVKADAS